MMDKVTIQRTVVIERYTE